MNPKNINFSFQDTGLTSNMEDYMETIYLLSKESKVVRVKDIAKKLNIKMPSVTAALNKLKEGALIEYEKYGFIELTSEGSKLAQQVYNRHLCLHTFFEDILGLKCEDADEVACKVEHNLTPESCQKIQRLIDFFEVEEEANAEWIVRLKKALTS
jgi:DtxR family transcriptional regulator, Mn-dependent transcriptional regulator